ncbi:MAG: RNA polymerase subunit sigma [Bacteroidetes bacterium GWC2_33_15]|nr:MAG: RNA polymerase subunit sigma [Bacteroidetes bacterium GWA2_33_15]OFX51096.1 MAG: RNA polymerase subunit sigma [Bacteroidetes bacterium GWC2_33_15]OFX66471.1 MAG: RNA polymerase subunit sigma [Bacteroidetes bacterium GWB2_32_14]OFX70304.1 MAG: RNA polymerase subunit sigma [Bacteroidetes bacterium GWD2_33_33]HAN17304.1 RNA polymerase subunit sigma [Bacteroidales bacterium]
MATGVNIDSAVELIINSKFAIAFTGAGISVESGIPPFRGKDGLWSKYDPNVLDLNNFFLNPIDSWKVIKEIFYDFFGAAKPNAAHFALSEMEKMGLIKAVITQNIDNLHTDAGSKEVYEFHGNSRMLVCPYCGHNYLTSEVNLNDIVPLCNQCHGVLKPDFIFFGESIPALAYQKSVEAAEKADLVIIIGSTGEVVPASMIPSVAKQNGAQIIEINPEKSLFTSTITDVFLQGKATEMMTQLINELKKSKI